LNGSSAAVLDPTQADILIEDEVDDPRTLRRLEFLLRRFDRRSAREMSRVQADLSGVKDGLAGFDHRLTVVETRIGESRIRRLAEAVTSLGTRQALGEVKTEQLGATQAKRGAHGENLFKAAVGLLLGALGFLAKTLLEKIGSP